MFSVLPNTFLLSNLTKIIVTVSKLPNTLLLSTCMSASTQRQKWLSNSCRENNCATKVLRHQRHRCSMCEMFARQLSQLSKWRRKVRVLRLEILMRKLYGGKFLKWGRGIQTWHTLEKGPTEWSCKCNRITVCVILMSIVSNLMVSVCTDVHP